MRIRTWEEIEREDKRMSDLWHRLDSGRNSACPTCGKKWDYDHIVWSSLGMSVRLVVKCGCGKWYAAWD